MSRVRSLALATALSTFLIPTLTFAAGHKHGNAPAPAPAPPSAAQQAATARNAAIVSDQKDIDAAKQALAKATKDLDDAVEQNPDIAAAKKTVADAAQELQTAKDAMLARLQDNADYKAAKAKEDALQKQLEDMRSNGADQSAISAKASEVYQAGSATSKMERDAELADPKVVAAQKKVADANTALAAAKNKAKSDPSVAALKTARDDAQSKLTAAQAKLDSDRKGTTATASTK